MPTPDQKEPDCYYWPKTYVKDKRLSYLDRAIYIAICGLEQDGKAYDISTLTKELGGSNPDRDEIVLDEYLAKTGKSLEMITDKELNGLPKVPLTIQEVEVSLAKLENFGYIKRL